ncbi:MAG: HAMP domain-containing histidine kinase [Ignavibacteria bacterium]|nr:HAMP domain-containing histidine kinase [Ignavibacteria bacterium]
MQNIDSLINSGIELRQTDPKSALKIFEKSYRFSITQNDEKNKTGSLFNIAIAYLNLADYPCSLKYFNESLNSQYAASTPELKAEIYRGFATNYLRTYNYRDALKYLYKSEEESLEAGHYENLHMVYGSFGSLYNKLKLSRKALEYTLKSLSVAEKLNDGFMKQYSIMSVGACYYQLGEFEKAYKYLNYSIGMNCNEFAEANALHFLSIIKFNHNEIDGAIQYAKRQIEISRKFNFFEYEALGYRLLGDIMFSKNRYKDAVDNYEKGVSLLEKIGEKLIYFSVCKKIINSYERMGETTKSNALYKKLYDEHIMHLEKEAHLKIEQIDIEYETERIKKEIDAEKQNNISLKRALSEVNELNSKLESMHLEKNDFMTVVVHDLKNPLQNIYSSIRLLNNDSFDTISKRELTENISLQADRMHNLINRLLDYKAIEEGNIKVQNSNFRPEELCRDIAGNMAHMAEKKGLKFNYENDLNGSTIESDYSILYQIIENLVSNAIKFSPLNKNIYIKTTEHNGLPAIIIQDEGPGFTKGDMKKVFSNFAKLSAQPTANEHSTGLGLSIVKKLCDFINAEVLLESEEGNGAKFILKFNNSN